MPAAGISGYRLVHFLAILNDFYHGDFDVVGATAYSFARFGQGIGPIFLDNVACVGTESRLIDCPANPIGNHNCVHSEDAGVGCLAPVVTTPAGIVSTTSLSLCPYLLAWDLIAG